MFFFFLQKELMKETGNDLLDLKTQSPDGLIKILSQYCQTETHLKTVFLRYHPFSTYPNFSEKLLFLTP